MVLNEIKRRAEHEGSNIRRLFTRGKVKRLVVLMTMLWGFGAALVLFNIWLNAYVNGGSVMVHVNKLGEAVPELYGWFLIWPIMVLGFFFWIEDFMPADR